MKTKNITKFPQGKKLKLTLDKYRKMRTISNKNKTEVQGFIFLDVPVDITDKAVINTKNKPRREKIIKEVKT